MKNYVVYHLHTEDSLLDSCTNYKLYVDRAAELGQKAIGFSEHGNFFRWTEKKAYVESKGLKYLHECEVYLTEKLWPKTRDNYHTILVAKNYDGVKEMNLLIGHATNRDHVYYKPRITFDEFFKISDNVIKISACLASPLSQYPKSFDGLYDEINNLQQEKINHIREVAVNLSEDNYNQYLESYNAEKTKETILPLPYEIWIENQKKIMTDVQTEYDKKIQNIQKRIDEAKETYHRLLATYDYYEIQPHVNSSDQIKYNRFLYEASKRYNKPLIAGTDTHSLDKYKAECRSILQKAKKIEYTDEDSLDLTYKSYSELVKMFELQNSIPMTVALEAIENTNRMADSVDEFIVDSTVKYPKLYDNEEAVLKEKIVEGLKYKLQHGIIDKRDLPKYKANIAEELRVFKKINMIGFMLFMSELTKWCWENGIPIGFCRGSVGGSTVAYITDIIDVDPVKWNTVFSRFANEDRKEVGDIDIDISPDQRDAVYEHIFDKFGYDKAAYILALGTVSDKGTIDEIGRALSIPLNEVAEIKNRYSMIKDELDSLYDSLKNAQENNNEKLCASIQEKINKANNDMKKLRTEDYPNLFYYFDGINGTVVSQSMHPAGIVVAPVTLPDNYGCFWNSDGKQIMYINMEEIHDNVGLVKYDLLGLKSLQVLRLTCEYAGIPYPKSYQINWYDDKVWDDMITSPAGIFQFESSSAFRMLKDFHPHKINDMSIVNAALRPSGASYRDRLLSGEINKNPSPMIDELLKANNGYLVFQEDVIKFLQEICGMSGSEADNLRRAIGRKRVDILEKALPDILDGYCKMSSQPRSVAEEEAKSFLKIIEDASSYMFGFNHSQGYSMIGYLCAYLRYYYPEEFIAAYLNCANNADDIVFGTNLAKLKNITINSIKYGKSIADYSVDKPNHAIYKGIESIKYCNAQIADELMTLSKENQYDNYIDLLIDIKDKTSVNSRQLEILTGLNFFSDFGGNAYLLQVIDLFDKFYNIKQVKKDKMSELGLNEYIMQKVSGKETAKLYKDINWVEIVKMLSAKLDDKSFGVVSQMQFEKEYLEYVDYIYPKAPEDIYVIIDYVELKDTTKPRFTARRISDGEEMKTRIKQSKVYKKNPFGLWSVLRIPEFSLEFKKKPNANGEWVVTNEMELILNQYEVLKR